MKKLTSLEDTATITITGRDAVRLITVLSKVNGIDDLVLYRKLKELTPNSDTIVLWDQNFHIDYYSLQASQEALAFPRASKKDLMLKELQSKMDDLQCEIDKIKGESF